MFTRLCRIHVGRAALSALLLLGVSACGTDDAKKPEANVVVAGPKEDARGKSAPVVLPGDDKKTEAPKAEPGAVTIPPILLQPDPKVEAEKKALAEKQQALLKWTTLALEEKTRGKALAGLRADFPELPKVIIDLVIDVDPQRVKNAFAVVSKMGPVARGAWPAIQVGAERMIVSKNHDAAVAGMETLARLAPDEPVAVKIILLHAATPSEDGSNPLRAAGIKALGICAPANPKEQDEIVKTLEGALGYEAVADDAVKTLAEVARTCPQARPKIAAAFDKVLKKAIDLVLKKMDKEDVFAKDPARRLGVVEALKSCSVDAKTAQKTLEKLETKDPVGPVRDAATAALTELARQQKIVPQLQAAGIVEGEIAAPLYHLAFAVAEERTTLAVPDGKKTEETKDEVYQALAAAPRDADLWRVLTGLAALPRPATARQKAVKLLSDWTAAQKELRPHAMPLFSAALADDATGGFAVDALLRCGVDGVQRLVSTKATIDKVSALRRAARDEDVKVRLVAVEGLAGFRATSGRALDALLDLSVEGKQPLEVNLAAAAGLSHLGPEQWFMAERILDARAQSQIRSIREALAKVLKNMGFETGDDFAASAFDHPHVDDATKKRLLDKIKLPSAGGLKNAESYVAYWIANTKLYKISPPVVNAVSTEVLQMSKLFGPKAKQLAPLLVRDLEDYLMGTKCAIHPKLAAESLGYIGAVPGVEVRGTLEDVRKVNPGTLPKSDQQDVSAAAAAALRKLK